MFKEMKKFIILLFPIVVLVLISIILYSVSRDMSFTVAKDSLDYLPDSVIEDRKLYDEVKPECLLITDSSQEVSAKLLEHTEEVLSSMRVSYDVADLAGAALPPLSKYKTAVIVFPDLDALGSDAVTLGSWVEFDGGSAMFLSTPFVSPVFRYFYDKFGVIEGATEFSYISGLRLEDNAMLGSEGFSYDFDEAMATALNVRLGPKATVYMWSEEDTNIPLLWSADCGEGRFVIHNHGMTDKTTRGLTAVGYSLLEDVCIYPVINASAFYLDDFPSPVPMGDGTYIRQYFNRGISSFYSNIWWPDMLDLAERYGIKYTGMIIQTYDEGVEAPFEVASDTDRFNYFGSMLLNAGGEIGLHGYNHQPLCLPNFDFKGLVDYNHWPTESDMLGALNEVMSFTNKTYEGNTVTCYVPPSNILSKEGREILIKNFPDIKVLSSLYLEGEIGYIQEFEVSEDGIIEFPRVISGCQIDPFMYWASINTLNLYYVNSHFTHPDDTLDDDRGAASGWDAMFENLSDYADWLYSSAHNIRNVTATEGGKAIQRFHALSMDRTDTEDAINLRLNGFWDEAYMMVRINKGEPKNVIGGTLDHISGDYYLLYATSSHVTIEMER